MPPHSARPRLLRADRLVELGLAEEAAREVAAGVGDPRDEQHEHDRVAAVVRIDALQEREERRQEARRRRCRRRSPRSAPATRRDVAEPEQVVEARHDDGEQRARSSGPRTTAPASSLRMRRVAPACAGRASRTPPTRARPSRAPALRSSARQRHAEELAHREQRREEDERPRRLGPVIVEQQQSRIGTATTATRNRCARLPSAKRAELTTRQTNRQAAAEVSAEAALARRVLLRGTCRGARGGTRATARRRTRARRRRPPTA